MYQSLRLLKCRGTSVAPPREKKRTLTSMPLAIPVQIGGRLLGHSVMLAFTIRLGQWRGLMFKVLILMHTLSVIVIVYGQGKELPSYVNDYCVCQFESWS